MRYLLLLLIKGCLDYTYRTEALAFVNRKWDGSGLGTRDWPPPEPRRRVKRHRRWPVAEIVNALSYVLKNGRDARRTKRHKHGHGHRSGCGLRRGQSRQGAPTPGARRRAGSGAGRPSPAGTKRPQCARGWAPSSPFPWTAPARGPAPGTRAREPAPGRVRNTKC